MSILRIIQDAPPLRNDTFTRLHLVPGFKYRVSKHSGLGGEIGIGLNDDSLTCADGSISFYF